MGYYNFKEIEEPVTVGGRTWTGFHAHAIHRLQEADRPLTAFEMVQAGREKVETVTLDLVRAKVIKSSLIGDPKVEVVRKVYALI